MSRNRTLFDCSAGRVLRIRGIVVLVSLLVPFTPVRGGDGPTYDDCKLSLQARQAVLNDSVLDSYSLGVRVKRRVATVWGAVPEKALAKRAVDKVRKVQGIAEVINHITVEPPLPVPLPARPTPRQPDPVPRQEPAVPQVQPQRQALPPDYAAKPSVPKLGATVALPTPPRVGQGISLLAPKTPTLAPDVARPKEKSDTDLASAVAAVCKTSVRYRHVRTEVVAGVVRLQGTVVRGEDLFALAQAIGRLPGVTRVVVDRVRIDPMLAIGPE